jgi:hypothetical protein
LPQRLLPNALGEVFDDFEMHVRFEQRDPHVTYRIFDVTLTDLTVTA